MSEPELQALADDIKKNGQHEPIVYVEGESGGEIVRQVIDGRNRLLACEIAGVEPWFNALYTDADDQNQRDIVALVLSKNLHRRHLTASQRAMIALEVEKLYAEQAKPGTRTDLEPRDTNVPRLDGRAAVKAAKALDVSPTYVKKAKALVEADPDKAADVKAGKVSLSAATAKPKPTASTDIYQDIRDVMNTGGITSRSKAAKAAREAWLTALTDFQNEDKPANAETWGRVVEASRRYRESVEPEPPAPKGGKRAAKKAEPETNVPMYQVATANGEPELRTAVALRFTPKKLFYTDSEWAGWS
jgi:ParB-like chromosome segregation protein Spo0J